MNNTTFDDELSRVGYYPKVVFEKFLVNTKILV